ncbi:MAG: hypothetical protein LBL86_05090 [Coriobacteriales bacterium]|jgi:hypothetical protein|nr:hypothetical protein [Coriobacteriales bacterium]
MPSWRDLERFLRHDGWEYRPKNSGTDKSYTKTLRTGEMLWTRVSKGTGEIGGGLFAAILRHQVKASKGYFNRVLAHSKHRSDDSDERLS